MSTSDIYPLGLIATQKITPVNSVLADAFEAGNSTTRKLWAANNFKRQIELQHASLTLSEWRYLRSFFSQRDGTYDSFWFRDNINRGGNILCRFAENIAHQHDDFLFNAAVKLNEVAPIRALPEWDEITTAAGVAPVLWYDPNREFDLLHAGSFYGDGNKAMFDSAAGNYPAPWLGGADPNLSSTRTSQYQTMHFVGQQAKTSANITELAVAQPAVTLFCITRSGTASAKHILFSIGAMGGGHALGLALAADNKLEPWLGGSETWTNARVTNVGLGSSQSIALVWTGASDNVTLYNNAASVGTDSNTRSLTSGPLVLGGALDLTLAPSDSHIAHILVFPAALTLAQIKAVHNLLGYQYGLATV